MIAPETKTCNSCGDTKPVTEFVQGKHKNKCKACWADYTRQWRKRRKLGLTGQGRGRPKILKKVCRVCGEFKKRDEYYIDQHGCARSECKECSAALVKDWRERNPEHNRQLDKEYKRRRYERDPEAMRQRWRYYNLRRKLRPAVEAYRTGSGVTADQVIDGMTENWRERVRLMCEVLDMAREG